jgi:hypothetical protein
MRAILHERSGVTSLEWALVAAAFMFMVISIFDLARYVVVTQSVATVMMEAGRACLVGNCPPDGNGWSQLPIIAPMVDSSQFNITAVANGSASSYAQNSACPAPSSVGQVPCGDQNASFSVKVIQITVTCQFQAWSPWLSMLNTTSTDPIVESATYFN